MKANEYQKLAMRTNDKGNVKRLVRVVENCELFNQPDIGGVLNASLGLSGEVGAFNDMIKKWIFHEKPLDMIHAKKEMGDILWYIALMCDSFGWDIEDVMKLNIEKLKNRYPAGFDTTLANNRKDGDV